MGKQWPPVTHWQDFEELCLALHTAEHKPTQSFKYGRAGQAQFGVDIVARDRSTHLWTGIQCKLKTELLGSILTQRQLIDAYEKSKQFEHGLEKLVVATTCPTDRDVQDLAAHISSSFQQRHPVEVMFWDQIEVLLDKHVEVAKRFYPEFFDADSSIVDPLDGSLHVTLTASDWEKRLAMLFKHRSFRAAVGGHAAAIATIASELVDNALNPGKGGASRVFISLSDAVLSIRDDGVPFDSVLTQTSLSPEMQGVRAIRAHLEASRGALQYKYIEADRRITRFNETRLHIIEATAEPMDPCRAAGPAHYLLSRDAAYKFVRELKLPPDCESFTLRLLGDEFFNQSATAQLITSLLARLGGKRLVIRVGQDCHGYLWALQAQANLHPEVSIELV
ncbi:hypothetical protein [Variovorax sp. OV700]|uniref:restriction endonuclease n=1 Tax=Variovorax sp. OV700 TaxID=1882826 RepID=UPI00088D3926|nr:hypothetical protein [Variovorax sp. OV700]SDI78230.1 Restriction endonuclease [Variovorax sp. OV700]